jgi:hypothetical protein
MTPDEPSPDELPVSGPQSWPGAGLYTLRAWVEVNVALERDVPITAAHALITDGAADAFGHRLFEWVSGALAAEGRDSEDLNALLDDDALAGRVLDQVRAGMREDDEAPDLPEEEYGWYTYSPDDPAGGRERFRRALRRRRRNARHALLEPPRRRVAGSRDR